MRLKAELIAGGDSAVLYGWTLHGAMESSPLRVSVRLLRPVETITLSNTSVKQALTMLADAPGTAAARNAEAAYNRAKQAAGNAKAARDAVSGATDKATADSALSRAKYAASDAQMAAEDAAMWAAQAASMKRAKAAKEEVKKAIMTLNKKLESVEEEAACGKNIAKQTADNLLNETRKEILKCQNIIREAVQAP